MILAGRIILLFLNLISKFSTRNCLNNSRGIFDTALFPFTICPQLYHNHHLLLSLFHHHMHLIIYCDSTLIKQMVLLTLCCPLLLIISQSDLTPFSQFLSRPSTFNKNYEVHNMLTTFCHNLQ